MKTIKDIFENIDLYGTDVLIAALQKHYSHVSFTASGYSQPTKGSPTRNVNKINPAPHIKATKLITHMDGSVTVAFLSPNANKPQFYKFINI